MRVSEMIFRDGVEPLYDYAICRRVETENVSPSGLHLPKGMGSIDVVEIIKVGKGGTLQNGERKKPHVKEGDYAVISPDAQLQFLSFDKVSSVSQDGKASVNYEYVLVDTHWMTMRWPAEAMKPESQLPDMSVSA